MRLGSYNRHEALVVDPSITYSAYVQGSSIDTVVAIGHDASGRVYMTGNTFSRVSYDIPGSYQRFARARAFRDAEDRACQEIADNIQTRLAAFFYAGT